MAFFLIFPIVCDNAVWRGVGSIVDTLGRGSTGLLMATGVLGGFPLGGPVPGTRARQCGEGLAQDTLARGLVVV